MEAERAVILSVAKDRFEETQSIYAAPVRVILSEAKDPLRACERRLTRSGSFAGAQDDSLRFLLSFAAHALSRGSG